MAWIPEYQHKHDGNWYGGFDANDKRLIFIIKADAEECAKTFKKMWRGCATAVRVREGCKTCQLTKLKST